MQGGKAEGWVRNVNGEGWLGVEVGGGRGGVRVVVGGGGGFTHRGVVLGEALTEKP